MSKNIVPIGVKQAIKPDFLDLKDQVPSFVVSKGGRQIRYYELKPTSGASGSGGENPSTTIFNIFTPTRETVMDPNLYLSCDVNVYLESNLGTASPLFPTIYNEDFEQGLRQFPITSAFIKTCNVEIDGNGVDLNLQQVQKHLLNYVYSEEELRQQNTTTPCLVSDAYSPLFLNANIGNPLNTIRAVSNSAIPGRGATQMKNFSYSIAPTDGEIAKSTYIYNLTEVLPISPFSLKSGNYESDPLYNVSNLKINISWDSSNNCFRRSYCKSIIDIETAGAVINSNFQWEVANTGAGTYVKNTLSPKKLLNNANSKIYVSNVVLYVGFYTPEITMTIPDTAFLDYKKFLYFTESASLSPNTFANVTAGTGKTFSTSLALATKTITLNNIQLSQVPRWVMFCVFNDCNDSCYQLNNGTANVDVPYYGQTSTYCPITNCNITVGNETGILSTASSKNLYQMNVKNGLKNVSWQTSGMHGLLLPSVSSIAGATATFGWLSPIGCPLKLMFGEDIQINDPLLAPGVSSNINFSATLEVCCPYVTTSATIPVTVQTIFCYDGVCTISRDQGGVYFSTSVIDKQDVIESSNSVIDGSMLDARTYGDGSFMKKLKKFTRSVARNLPQYIDKGLDYAKKGVEFAEQHKGDIAKAAATTAMLAAAGNGGVLVGGRLVGGAQTMSRGQLRKRVQMQ